MPYVNIPSIGVNYLDGNLSSPVTSSNPKILILGTAASGRTDANFRVTSSASAISEFGNEGTLIRAMHEVMQNGADNIFLRRLPTGSPAILENICRPGLIAGTGITITTIEEDAEAGERYAIWADSATARLAIYDLDEDEWIYDSEGVLAVDLGRISVVGTIESSFTSIGTEASPVPMNEVETYLNIALSGETSVGSGVPNSSTAANTNFGTEYYAGTDGVSPSRMELFEAMLEVFQELDFEDLDFLVVPPEASIDAPNVVNGRNTTAADALIDYPTAGDYDTDILGRVYIQEVDHKLYFWWNTRGTVTSSANIFPSIGSASANADGTALTSTDFHEVNFAWAIAKFCHKASTSWSPVMAVVGVERPRGFDRLNVAQWIGELPDYDVDGVNQVVTANGDGLLGIKFLAGEDGYNDSLRDGGFLDTEEDYYLDGTVVNDANSGRPVDIGRYLVINAHWPILSNPWVDPNAAAGRARPYVNSAAALEAGKLAVLPAYQEPAGNLAAVRGVSLSNMKIPASALDRMNGIRLNAMRNEEGLGAVLVGVKTAARPDSDYTKISTIRTVAMHVKRVMEIGRNYQGRPMDAVTLAGFQNQLDSLLSTLRSQGFARNSAAQIRTTTADMRLGRMTIQLRIAPPNCLETITIEVSLSDS